MESIYICYKPFPFTLTISSLHLNAIKRLRRPGVIPTKVILYNRLREKERRNVLTIKNDFISPVSRYAFFGGNTIFERRKDDLLSKPTCKPLYILSSNTLGAPPRASRWSRLFELRSFLRGRDDKDVDKNRWDTPARCVEITSALAEFTFPSVRTYARPHIRFLREISVLRSAGCRCARSLKVLIFHA